MSGEIVVAEADNGHGFRDMKFAFLCFDDRAMGQEIRATEHHATGKALIVPEFAQSATALCDAGRAGQIEAVAHFAAASGETLHESRSTPSGALVSGGGGGRHPLAGIIRKIGHGPTGVGRREAGAHVDGRVRQVPDFNDRYAGAK